MKIFDRIFAWILLLLGCAHCAVAFVVHKRLSIEAIWFFSGGLAVIFGALLNLLRLSCPDDRLAARVSALANLLLFAVFAAALPWLVHREITHNPQVIVVGIAVVAEFGFSLRQCFR